MSYRDDAGHDAYHGVGHRETETVAKDEKGGSTRACVHTCFTIVIHVQIMIGRKGLGHDG